MSSQPGARQLGTSWPTQGACDAPSPADLQRHYQTMALNHKMASPPASSRTFQPTFPACRLTVGLPSNPLYSKDPGGGPQHQAGYAPSSTDFGKPAASMISSVQRQCDRLQPLGATSLYQAPSSYPTAGGQSLQLIRPASDTYAGHRYLVQACSGLSSPAATTAPPNPNYQQRQQHFELYQTQLQTCSFANNLNLAGPLQKAGSFVGSAEQRGCKPAESSSNSSTVSSGGRRSAATTASASSGGRAPLGDIKSSGSLEQTSDLKLSSNQNRCAQKLRGENESWRFKTLLTQLVLASNVPFAYTIMLVAFLITMIAATSIITILTIVLTLTGYTAYPITENTFNTSLAIGVVCASFALALVTLSLIVWRRHCQAAYYYLDEPQDASRATNSPQLSETYDDSEYGSIPVSEWMKHVQKLHQDSDIGFSREFEQIQQANQKQSLALTSDHSHLPENKHKNRYINIVAYDHTRVILRPPLGGQKKPGYDYINANFIDVSAAAAREINTQFKRPA